MSDPEKLPTIIYDFNPYSLPSEYRDAVGLIITCSSQTESTMLDLIGGILKIDNVSTIALGAHMSTPLKNDILRSISELKCPSASELDRLDDLLDAVAVAMAKRNAIAHSAFGVHPENGEIYRLKESARGRLTLDFERVTAEELQAIAKEIYDTGMALTEFMASRGILPKFREEPLREPISRKKKARQARRAEFGDRY
jgi:hypothetical protein